MSWLQGSDILMGDTFTIQISSGLIRRLANEETTKSSKKANPKSSTEQQPRPLDRQKEGSNVEKSASPSRNWPLQTPTFFPVSPPPSSSAIAKVDAIKSVLKESEEVLEKLEKQEAKMVQELTQRAKELREKEFKLPNQKPTPCLSERDACVQCYKEHLKEPLNCASVVNKFTECARQARQQFGGEIIH
ncbi:hypothetical protein HPP92_004973 [Vanilla planifolia]|uniref:Uncharacterized protein n=1 Tax=Vanilla planifolia TaxID=51239 RepID=A0A835RRC0_VANPL|nr:hypothetical protein HPP92_005292 [Vanilla planifolia]KAG0493979.1 hypothetical protein HPP92_004973 [Vanilla planifolia]